MSLVNWRDTIQGWICPWCHKFVWDFHHKFVFFFGNRPILFQGCESRLVKYESYPSVRSFHGAKQIPILDTGSLWKLCQDHLLPMMMQSLAISGFHHLSLFMELLFSWLCETCSSWHPKDWMILDDLKASWRTRAKQVFFPFCPLKSQKLNPTRERIKKDVSQDSDDSGTQGFQTFPLKGQKFQDDFCLAFLGFFSNFNSQACQKASEWLMALDLLETMQALFAPLGMGP